MKKVKCNICNGGFISELKSTYKNDNDIIRIYSKKCCEKCNGTGYIKVSIDEYNSIVSDLNKRIDKFSISLFDIESSMYAMETECDKCKGKGDIEAKTIDLNNDKYYIVTTHLCDKCHGKGSIIDIEATRKIIEHCIEVCNNELKELIGINNVETKVEDSIL